MNKRKLIVIFALSIIISNIIFSGLAMAQSAEVQAVEVSLEKSPVDVEVYLGDPNEDQYLKPDLHGIKELLEKIQLYLVLPPEYRTDILIGLTQRPLVRLPKEPEIDTEEKEQITVEILEDYLLQQATIWCSLQQEEEEITIKFEAYDEVLSKIEMVLSINLDLLENIKEKLPEVEESIAIIQENLQIIKKTIVFLSQLKEKNSPEASEEEIVVVIGDMDPELIPEETNGEFRFIQIFAEKANKTVEEILKLREDGSSWRSIAQKLELSLGSVAQELNRYLIVLDQEVKAEEIIGDQDEKTDPENIEENITQLLKVIKENKEKDLKILRQELEKAKERIKGKQEVIKVPALVEDMLKEKTNSKNK